MKSLSNLPKEHGFEFIGIGADGSEIECILKLNVKANKYRIFDRNGNSCYHLIESWRDKNEL